MRVVQDGAGALTIGLLVVGALFAPGRKTPAVTLQAARYAVASGVVWVVATLLGVVLGFADAAGTPVGHPEFWSQLTEFVWTLETLRVAIISALVAAVATTVAAMSLTRKGIATAAFLAVAALLPLALAGHASGNADHETAVNTIAAHLVGASLWIGGLLALVVLRPALGRHLPTVVARYSGMALWCFVAVAVSGVVSAVIRLGGVGELGNLATAYGALILVKTACLVVLGLLGWQQRRRVVGRMAAEGPGRGLFLRFAVTELVVMGVAVGFATALSRTPTPASPPRLDTSAAAALTGYPEPAAPTATTWLTLWRYDWLWGCPGGPRRRRLPRCGSSGSAAAATTGASCAWSLGRRLAGPRLGDVRRPGRARPGLVLVAHGRAHDDRDVCADVPRPRGTGQPRAARPARPRRTAASARVSCCSGWSTRGCCACSATRSSRRRCSSSASWCSTTRRCSGWPSRPIPGTC